MPSGPPELHEKWCNYGPTDGGDWNAIQYLESNGYKMTKHFFWVKPTPDHEPTAEENSAMDYLFLEWDFGGIVET